jgi:hypothetical protein
MELLILLGFLTGWFVCWMQGSGSPSRSLGKKLELYQVLAKKLESELAQEKETAKGLTKQLHSHLETVAVQEMEILKALEKVTAQERELDLLRYRT